MAMSHSVVQMECNKGATMLEHTPEIIPLEDVQLFEAIGSGNFGEVYRGCWKRRSSNIMVIPIAVKTLKVKNEKSEASWKKEVSIFTSLHQNHPCIIRFFGLLYCDNEEIKMVSEYAAYGSLLDQLQNKCITLIEVLCQFCVQIASAMVYLHSKNIVHRDVSARNILVTAPNQVKLSDFGLSKTLSEHESEFVMESSEMLPVRWLAPESFNHGVFNIATDVWSFGVTLWEMFTFGEQPWSHLNNTEVQANIKSGAVLPEPDLCPHGYFEIMMQCFRVDAQLRPRFLVLHKELSGRHPKSYSMLQDQENIYDLNYKRNEIVTAVKPLSICDEDDWLGQHNESKQFGRFNLSFGVLSSHSIMSGQSKENMKTVNDSSVRDYVLMTGAERDIPQCKPPAPPLTSQQKAVQQTVNQKINLNMEAFLTQQRQQELPTTPSLLQPEIIHEKRSLAEVIRDIDPFGTRDNIYESIQSTVTRLNESQKSISEPQNYAVLRESNKVEVRPCNRKSSTVSEKVNQPSSWCLFDEELPTAAIKKDNLSQKEKQDYCESFKALRSRFPQSSIAECLDALRNSNNDLEKSLHYMAVFTLTQLNLGFLFDYCEKVFIENKRDINASRRVLSKDYISERFTGLDRKYIIQTLLENKWDIKSAMSAIFFHRCEAFGVERCQALPLLNECDNDVLKAEEMAKIVRLAEITGKSKSRCFVVLTRMQWRISDSVEYMLVNS